MEESPAPSCSHSPTTHNPAPSSPSHPLHALLTLPRLGKLLTFHTATAIAISPSLQSQLWPFTAVYQHPEREWELKWDINSQMTFLSSNATDALYLQISIKSRNCFLLFNGMQQTLGFIFFMLFLCHGRYYWQGQRCHHSNGCGRAQPSKVTFLSPKQYHPAAWETASLP